MKNNLFCLVILVFFNVLVCNALATDYVSSVRSYQEGKNIIITYELSKQSDIAVSVSTDGGKTFSPLKNISGDIGDNVKPGNKQIIWDVLSDYEQFIFHEVCFKVVPFNNNGHEYVDLGLPSGLLWATCNVGATKPEERGEYFAWGETKSKVRYSWETYKWGHGSENTQTKYCIASGNGRVDNNTMIDLIDDAAYVNWGGDWRMPTKVEQDELRNPSYTTWIWATQNGVKGYKVTSKTNGNSIFLPITGAYVDYDYILSTSDGFYLSSSLYTNDSSSSNILTINADYVDLEYASRFYGLTIRAVLPIGSSHRISFDSNGGNGTMLSFAIKGAELFSLPKNILNRPGCEFICWNTKADGTGINYEDGAKFKANSDITLYAQWYKKETNITHEYVDMGLPSGIKWATCNVGADSPEKTGYFFSWGETKPKARYCWGTYKWCLGSEKTQTKYCIDSGYGRVDNKTMLDLLDDVAYVNWGGEWRMPTKEEYDELRNPSYTNWIWTSKNGVKGYKVTSKTNGNSIFLPAAGIFGSLDLSFAGSRGYYWSSYAHAIYLDDTSCLDFNSSNVDVKYYFRYFGMPVRPVKNQ